jgi:hypothetical protein
MSDPTTYCGLTLETYRMSYLEANRLYDKALEADDLAGIKRWTAECRRLTNIITNWRTLIDA